MCEIPIKISKYHASQNSKLIELYTASQRWMYVTQ